MTQAIAAPARAVAAPLPEALLSGIGENVYRCYQCSRCSSGCPLADRFDWTPNQIMRGLQLNDARVLETRTVWLCANCQTCTTRCPQEIDVTGVMDALRIEATRRGIPPAIPEIARFNALFMGFVRWFGRIPELLFILVYNLLERRPFRDLDMGLRLMRRGRLKPQLHFARPPRVVARLADTKNKVAYFPGCAAQSSAAEYDRTARAVAEALGLELIEPPGWTCCGASAAHATDAALALRLPLRTLSTIEKMGLDTVTSPCSNCFARLKAAEVAAAHDPAAGREMEAVLGEAYRGAVRVQHLLDTLLDRVSLAEIERRVKRPLRELRVACYYGCLITRPSRVTGAEHAEYPLKMDHLVRALGAESVEWSGKTDCCGGSLSLTQTSLALEMSRKVLDNARACGAEAVVTMCPLCHMNLDARQRALHLDRELPILHATQLMLLAFGRGADEALLHKNLVDPRPLLGSKRLLDPPAGSA
ncbi:MAG: heterodisulfide reductase-related iron-sulfur binding cluster [Myxococcales bacterium]|nr:heterodisulfide reductase-related iron-sulfur binding cluster [Myxococcales bacterium]MDH5305989.1 heterodisulfide reductase-related iron-sulfur binding cluster [Myxococcales bacterium]MDH5565522.1 heterodisulfide reductase-related iron-sulfur binding cluster [Myxococcales bacterium]